MDVLSKIKWNNFIRQAVYSVAVLSLGFLGPLLLWKISAGVLHRDKNVNLTASLEEIKSEEFTQAETENIEVVHEEPGGVKTMAEVFPKEDAFVWGSGGAFPDVEARAFLIADLDTGQIIRARNENSILPVASITKLMTQLVSLEAVNQHKTIKISEKAVSAYGDAGGVRVGEEIVAKYLIYPLLLESSNDVAVALAESAGESNFVGLMNKRADTIGLESTYYEEPTGLSENNVSTASDIFKLLQYINREKKFILEITAKETYNMSDEKGNVTHYWRSNNSFVTNEDFVGGKNGYTHEAGQTAAAIFSLPIIEFKNINVAVVLLGSDDREREVAKILKWLKEGTFSSVDLAKDEDGVVSLFFGGDIMLDRGVEQMVDKYGDGNYYFSFENLDIVRECDIAFANLEGPISNKGSDGGSINSFRFEPEALSALSKAGFDVLSVANNHAGDWGREAFVQSLTLLKSENIVPVGGGISENGAYEVKIIEKRGVKIGFLAFSDVGPGWFSAGEDRSGIAVVKSNFGDVVDEASSKTDILIVSLHFGNEYELVSNERQKEIARLAIDSGAKIVIGHHPHVIQEVESYNGGVIAYSLGNLVFDQNFSEETMEGLTLEVYIENGNVSAVEKNKIKINRYFQPEPVK